MIALHSRVALAGDDQDGLQAARLRSAQESVQLNAGIALAHAVQVEAGLDGDLARCDLAHSAAVELRKRRRSGRL